MKSGNCIHPVASARVCTSVAEARAVPLGEMRLQADPVTGRVFNAAFDPATQLFDAAYEETQMFSGVYRAYAADVIARLDARFDLQGRRVLEIGCGKGYFLELLAAETGALCTGIDPVAEPGSARLGPSPLSRLLAETLAPDHATLAPEILLCRHTLEHIADPVAFLALMGQVAPGATLFLDVPNAEHVLRDGLFDDIYYEHASYFDAESLRQTVEAAGWTAEDVRVAYYGQCLEVFATWHGRPARTGAAAVADLEMVGARVAARVARVTDWLAQSKGSVVLWGGGSRAVASLAWLRGAPQVVAAVDINPHKRGCFLPGTGVPVIGPEDLPAIAPDTVLIMNPVYHDEIAAVLAGLGLSVRLEALQDL